MAWFNIDPDTIDFDALPALVRRGEDREAILRALVEAWCVPIAGSDDVKPWDVISPHVTLDRVRLVDENTGTADPATGRVDPKSCTPIDLVDLLNLVAARLFELNADHPRAPDREAANADVLPTAIANVHVVLRGCDVPACGGGGQRLSDLPCSLTTTGCRFAAAGFAGARIGGAAGFAGARIGGDARFDGARIGGAAAFLKARIGGAAGFYKARIGGVAWFEAARIGGDARFHEARIGGDSGFDSARIGGDARFASARIGGAAVFLMARIGGAAEFREARIGGAAAFHMARIGGFARFVGARIGGVAWFEGARIGGYARFDAARIGRRMDAGGGTFVRGLWFPDSSHADEEWASDPALHGAAFHTTSTDSARFKRPEPLRPWWSRALWRLWTRGDAKLNWGLVRTFGELAVLTRASVSMLVIVPVLAGAWPAIRLGIEAWARRDPRGESLLPANMPWVFGALFFAALFVVAGRTIYQSKVPQLIREKSRFDLVRDEMEEFRKTRGAETERRLREAVGAIEEAGKHPLMSSRGRTPLTMRFRLMRSSRGRTPLTMRFRLMTTSFRPVTMGRRSRQPRRMKMRATPRRRMRRVHGARRH